MEDQIPDEILRCEECKRNQVTFVVHFTAWYTDLNIQWEKTRVDAWMGAVGCV
jgi:hypothetical protein